MSSEESGDSDPPARRTRGKGGSRDSSSGSRDRDDVEDLEADDEAAAEAQARLDEMAEDVEENLEDLVEDLDEVQAGGPPVSESPSGSAGTEHSRTETSQSSAEQSASQAEPPVAEWSVVPSTSEFARSVLVDEAVAAKHLEGDGDVPVDSAAEPSHEDRYGGLDEFSEEDVKKWSPIKSDDDEGRGFTDHAKYVGEIEEDSELEAHAVYRTDYGDGVTKVENPALKANQMAVYSFAEELGVETPRFTYDADRDAVISETVAKDEDYGYSSVKDLTKPEWANQVSREEYLDKLAVQALCGNWDTTSDNISIGEDGTVLTYDYDRGDREFGDFRSLQHVTKRAANSSEKIDELRDSDNKLDITREDIALRAAEIGYELERSGRDKEVVDTVREQMNAIVANSDASHADADNDEIYERNIEVAAEIARDQFGWP